MAPKTQNKAQKKVNAAVADRTFGMKNKNKSKKVQDYVNQVKAAAKHMGKSRTAVLEDEKRKAEKEAKRMAKEAADLEMKQLFKTVVGKQTEVPAGVDPRTVICAYFKAGKCVRGQKCKFSHNMEQERKTSKLSLYVDLRDNEKQADSMDKWDQAKLEAVVEAQAKKKPANETQIVCKHFLDAIEKLKYGWFWECPTDKKAREENLPVGCIYKHRLPPGFVFTPKVDKKLEDMEQDDTALQLMEDIEEERKKLDLSKCTPVTLETFKKWKADKQKKKEAEIEAKRKEEAKKSGGRGLGVLSGRDLFKYDPSLFVDDADAVDDAEYQIEDKDETEDQMRDRLATEAKAEEEEMVRRAQFEARAELYRNDASADALTAAGAVQEKEIGGTTTAVAFQLPASLMAKPKPVVGDASLFDDDEAPDEDADGGGADDGDADADGAGEGDGDGAGDAGGDDAGEGEAAAADGDADAGDGGEGDAAAADADADADADTAEAAADADGEADADADADAGDAKAAPAAAQTKTDDKKKPSAAASSAAAAATAPSSGAAPAASAKPAVATVGDASLFDEDLGDLPDG